MSRCMRSVPFRQRLVRGLCRGLLSLILVASAVLSAGCSTNPVTGKSQLNALSRDQEIALGEKSAPELLKS